MVPENHLRCSDVMLPPEELSKYRSRDFVKQAKSTFSVVGQKLAALSDSASAPEEQECVNTLLESLFARLNYRKVGRLCDLCKIEYDQKTRRIKLMKKAGKVQRNMGFPSSDQSAERDLYPEEALFLLDCGDAQIYFGGVPIGFSEALSRFSVDFSMPLKNYLVYSHLIRAGYIVRRRPKLDGICLKNDVTEPNGATTCARSANGRTGWNFDEVRIPDDFGSSLMMLETPKEEHLPFPLQYDKRRLLLTYEHFSKSPKKSTLLSKNRSFIDARRREERASFHRPNNWTFLDVKTLNSWPAYKQARLIARSVPEAPRTPPTSRETAQQLNVQRPSSGSDRKIDVNLEISYDVYLSDSGFTLTGCRTPRFSLVVIAVDEPLPTNADLVRLNQNTEENVPLRFAVVDGGEILFFDLTVRPVYCIE